MKKLFSIIACVICAAVFASVSFAAEAPDAYSIYKRATRYLEEAKSVEMTSTAKTVVLLDGEQNHQVLQHSRIAVVNPNGADIQMSALTAMTPAGDASQKPENISVYYKDGYMYTSDSGHKYRIQVDIAKAAAQASQLDTTLTKEALANAVVEKVDGGTRINFTIDLNKFEGGSESFIKEMIELAGDMQLKIGEIDYSVFVGRDNKLKSYDVFFVMDMVMDGTAVCTQTKASYLVISVDQVDSIDFPADLIAYKTL